MPLIVEGVMTTVNPDGTANVAPLGPVVDQELTQFLLRPYQTSTTFANLRRTGEGVFHVTDDAELIARAAVLDTLEPPPALEPCPAVPGFILREACRWYALRVERIDASQPRAEMQARVVGQGTLREFWGFQRAKHAVLEAAILATRIGLLPPDELRRRFAELRPLVEKTGGPAEARAFALLERVLEERLG